MEPIVLITGFEPFGGETINPSWEAVQRLPERIGGFTLHKLQIPTVFEAAAQKVLSEAEGCQPRVILSVGQAGGRKEITPERIGVNLRRAATPDNAGNQPQGEGIVLNGPDGIFSTCPVEAIDPASPRETDGERCIRCLACVHACPTGSRRVEGAAFSATVAHLEEALTKTERPPELYL